MIDCTINLTISQIKEILLLSRIFREATPEEQSEAIEYVIKNDIHLPAKEKSQSS